MVNLKALPAKVGLDGFIGAILLMVVLAYFFPAAGMVEHPVSLEDVASYGVAGIFFFYGLKLNMAKMKAGLANTRMHLVIQLTTFLLFPLIALAIKPFFHTPSATTIWMGIFFLCSLPSTVSSSVVMVSIANGNMPAAIFNASISSLIGIFVTPLWVGVFLSADTGGFDSGSIAGKLVVQVVLPVVLGILLNRRFGAFAERHKKRLKLFDQSIILIIIYASFCKSFYLHIFKDLSWGALLALATGMLALFFAVMLVVNAVAGRLKFSRQDKITVMFCGSKKSLVHGTVMSKVLFAGSMAGIIILPLMLYHALQLIAASILAQRMAREEQAVQVAA